MPQIEKEKKVTLLCYRSGLNDWTCLDKLYKGKVPKKDTLKGSFIEKKGIIKETMVWFEEPIKMNNGSVLYYWPIGEFK